MRFRAIGRLRLAAFVFGVLGLAAGGIAYATIPDSSGVIHACYKKNQGTLRVIDTDRGQTCLPGSEKSLDWSESGPAGPEGWDAGLVGRLLPDGTPQQLGQGGEPVITPGSYLISGSVTWHATIAGSASVFCILVATGTDVSISTFGGFGTASPLGGGTLALNGSMTINSGTATLGIECSETGTTDLHVDGRVHALELGTLHEGGN